MAFQKVSIEFAESKSASNGEDSFLLRLVPGEITMITGPNGVGKSALLDEISAAVGTLGERLAGFRQVHFTDEETEEVGQTTTSLRENLSSGSPRYYSRYRHAWAEQHLKSFIKRLKDTETENLSKIFKAQEAGASFLSARDQYTPLFSQINSVFQAAKIPVKVEIIDGIIKSKRGSSIYTIDRMSDGERAALILVSAILVQPNNGCLIIDEPERHLSSAISAPLIASATRLRPDLAYVFASHDASLIEALQPQSIVHIRDSALTATPPDWGRPENRVYDLHLIEKGDGLPIDLKIGLLGSRKALLLTEGTDVSEDRTLYSHVYPGWHVLARGGNETVTFDVPAINEHGSYAWLEVAGLVDGDGRTESEKRSLLEKRVYCLPCPTIENVFFLPEVVSEMAEIIFSILSGSSPAERIAEAYKASLDEFRKSTNDIINRRVVWAANRKLSEKKISVKSVRDGLSAISGIDILPLVKEYSDEMQTLLKEGEISKLLVSAPIKNSSIPAKFSQAMGYQNFNQYKTAFFAQMERNTSVGERIISALRAFLPKISTENS